MYGQYTKFNPSEPRTFLGENLRILRYLCLERDATECEFLSSEFKAIFKSGLQNERGHVNITMQCIIFSDKFYHGYEYL